MARQRKDAPKTPSRRRSSPKPTPTPRRSLPRNAVLRSLSTPLRTRSCHPVLRALSTPIRRRSEYHPLVRRLCQEGAHKRVPYDNDLYVAKTLRCERCLKTGTFTQNIVFKQGHAGEWVRACQTPGCGLVSYPAQPGTPPHLLARIEAAREATALSSTLASPELHTSHSSSSFASDRSQDLDAYPSIGGQMEDWLSPLFRELDMETMHEQQMPSTSNSVSPDRVAGPSTGPGTGSVRNAPPQCARDEEIARMLQVALDNEDALLLQQWENASSPEPSPARSDSQGKPTMLSSLTAELAAITGTRPSAAISPSIPSNLNESSHNTSRESSPSPRPRKKKRILLKRSPTPPRVKRKYYGPPPSPPRSRARATVKRTEAKPQRSTSRAATRNDQVQSHAQPSAGSSTTRAPPAPQRGPPTVIVISSEDESAPLDGAEEDSVIDITSSDSDDEGPCSATQSQTARPHVGQLSARRSAPATQPRKDSPAPSAEPRDDSPPPATQPRTPRRRVGRARRSPSAPGSRDPSPPLTTQPRSRRTLRPTPSTASAYDAIGSDVIDITSDDSDRDGPSSTTQHPATSRDVQGRDRPSLPAGTSPPTLSRGVIRSRAPSRSVEALARPAHNDSENDGAALGARTRSLPAIVAERDTIETGSSNKENDFRGRTQSSLDLAASSRLSARQSAARRSLGLFALLGQTSSSSSVSSSHAGEVDDDVSHVSSVADPLVEEDRFSPSNAGEHIDASEVFGDPFRFKLYPAVSELAKNYDPDAGMRRWVLTVKLWYKNNVAPSTKMIPLDRAACSIRLSDIFIVARAFQSTGITNVRIWSRFTTDWEMHSLHDYLAVSITDNHTLLIRFPTVATLSCWAETISQAYRSCQTVDPRLSPSRKGKEPAYN